MPQNKDITKQKNERKANKNIKNKTNTKRYSIVDSFFKNCNLVFIMQ